MMAQSLVLLTFLLPQQYAEAASIMFHCTTPKECFVDSICEHVADFTTQRRRAHWITALVNECENAPSPGKCMEVGAIDISRADKEAWQLLWSDCEDATMDAPSDRLDAVAEVVFGNESVDGIVGPWRGVHRLTDKLDTQFYQKTADEAKKQSKAFTSEKETKEARDV